MRFFVTDSTWELLEKLARFWVWRRQYWVKQLAVELRDAEAKCELELSEKNNLLEKKLGELVDSKIVISDLKSEAAQLSSCLEIKERELDKLQRQHAALDEKYSLVKKILSAHRQPSTALDNFKRILHEDYLTFANEEGSLAEEAEALLHLQGVEQKLEVISSFPALYGKSQIAISGGFSAGKSEFLNGLILNKDIRLPTGIETVTSIPTYLTCAEKTEIHGYTSSGGCITLDDRNLKLISHEYVKSFGFEIRKLMPFMSVNVQLDPERFSHICFIDTPGYDPASANSTSENDREVAKRFAEGAQALLWVMGADSGQVSSSDIDFIESLSNFSDIPVYVVISKSEQRKDEIDEILDLVDLTFESSSIKYFGVSAEDAIFRGKYGHRRMTIDSFFSLFNRSSHIEKDLCETIGVVFERYIKAIQSDIDKSKALTDSLKAIDLDVFAEGDMTLSGKVSERVEEVKSMFQLTELNNQKKKAKELGEKLQGAVCKIFSGIK